MPTLAVNKQARYNYSILDTYEAGIVLRGFEVKSAKEGNINLKGAYVTIDKSEAYLVNCHIGSYTKAGPMDDYDPARRRKLLLHKREIRHLTGKLEEKGLTLVALKVYTIHNRVKLEFGIGKGKKKYDKREDIKKRDVKRSLQRAMKHSMQ